MHISDSIRLARMVNKAEWLEKEKQELTTPAGLSRG